MSHLIEQASSGRAKCRGCGERIAKGHLAAACCLQSPSSFESIAIPPAIREKLCDMLEAEPG